MYNILKYSFNRSNALATINNVTMCGAGEERFRTDWNKG